MLMMSDEQELQDPSFHRQTGLLIHINTYSPYGMAGAIHTYAIFSQGTSRSSRRCRRSYSREHH